MDEWNQAPNPDPPAGGPVPPSGPGLPGAFPEAARPGEAPSFPGAPPAPGEAPPADPAVRRARRGLTIWLGILLVLGLGAMLLDQPEAAALVALAGLFAAAQAADADPLWRRGYSLLALVAPLGAALMFGYLVPVLAQAGLRPGPRGIATAIAVAGAVVSALSAFPRVADAIVRRLFRGATPSHTRRLAAQLTIAGILVAVPAWFAFNTLMESMLEGAEPLLQKARLGGGLVGYVLLALGGVGCWIRRDLRESCERLGLKAVTLRHAGVILAGAVALFALNTGAELIQHRFFPALWKTDHEMTRLLARGMTPGRVLMLGLSAGVGEEITLRGGLQPALGVLLTAVLFAALHVQYSWFGMALVFALGLILGLIRKRASTTAAIVVHGLYDVLAVFTS